jgi:hypothetical protein
MYQSIYFDKYKSFSEKKENALEGLKNVNVIIGKNNSGKSSVLDVICYAHKKDHRTETEIPTIEVDMLINAQKVRHDFKAYPIFGFDRWEDFVDRYKNIPLRFSLYYKDSQITGKWKPTFSKTKLTPRDGNVLKLDTIAEQLIPNNFTFRRLSAERDIISELESDYERMDRNGKGATDIIRKFTSHRDYNEDFVEKMLLDALNEIMSPESRFENIRVQQRKGDKTWEVFIREKDCERFALSQSGSGLKTIILLLLNLLVIPQTEEYKNKHITYGFEELENNLHPAIQRKVFEYIYKYATEKNLCIFLTTHSHIAIDSFFGKDKATIYHVVKNDNVSTIKKIDNYSGRVEILDDLNVKASDLLQSNGIVWVEGPSDRIYIKRWLEMFCDCKYEEGNHYQFMYYGGRNLFHYSTEEIDGLINILITNRNASIVMDSDRKNEIAPLNETKQRIISEFNNRDMFCWLTKGKEIENYISADAVNKTFDVSQKQCQQYEKFPDYINSTFSNFTNQKVDFAKKVKDFITAENSKSILDLEKQIKCLYTQIESWNK